MTLKYKMTGRYAVGWSDPRGIFGATTRQKDPLYEHNFFDNLEEFEQRQTVANMNVDALITLWLARYGEEVLYSVFDTQPIDPFLLYVGQRLHKLGYLVADQGKCRYHLAETPHGL